MGVTRSRVAMLGLLGLVVLSLLALHHGPGVTVQAQEGGGGAVSLTISSPRGVYFPGQDVDVGGSAATGIDEVAVYVREAGDWHLLDLNEDGQRDDGDAVNVNPNGTWLRRGVTLSNASRLLDIPGQYRIGVIDAVDARNRRGNLSRTLTPNDFVSGTAAQEPLSVKPPRLEGAFQTRRGQVATDDGAVAVQGISRGMPGVLVVMVDSRGNVATQEVPARGRYDVFDEDVPLLTPADRPLSQGHIVGLLVALGRDDVAGDGSLPAQETAGRAALAAYVQSLGPNPGQEQVVSRIYEQTSLEAGSDDMVREQRFTFTDGETAVRSVVPASAPDATGVNRIEVGETMLIRGVTNRKPDDNTIRVELTRPGAPLLPIGATDEWGPDGHWSVAIDTSGAEAGVYELRVQVGNGTSDLVTVELVPPGQRGPLPRNETTTAEPTGNATTTPDGPGPFAVCSAVLRSIPGEHCARPGI